MIFILVVLYNKSLETSETLKGLLENAYLLKKMNALVFIWDNSPMPVLTQTDLNLIEQNFFFQYHHCASNKPLAKIYNEIIEKLLESDKYKYFIVFDHDSNVSGNYFEELNNIVQLDKEIDIIRPLAINNGIIISPAKLFFIRGNYFRNIPNGLYNGKLLAVNSGMAISMSFISKTNFRYDKRLMSYGTDNFLMNFANQRNAKYYIMKASFLHGYNFYDFTDTQKKAKLFSQIKQANKIAFSLNIWQSIMIRLYNFFSSFKNAAKYKSFKFFS